MLWAAFSLMVGSYKATHVYAAHTYVHAGAVYYYLWLCMYVYALLGGGEVAPAVLPTNFILPKGVKQAKCILRKC